MLGDAKPTPFCRNTTFSGSQNVNHSAEIQSLAEHEVPTVQQTSIMLGNAKCKPFSRNAPFLGSQNANRSAEMQSLGQPSRIP